MKFVQYGQYMGFTSMHQKVYIEITLLTVLLVVISPMHELVTFPRYRVHLTQDNKNKMHERSHGIIFA